jgi:hypothetical protein
MAPDLARQVASTTRSILQTRRLAQRLRVEAAEQRAQIAASRRRIQNSVAAIHRAAEIIAVLGLALDKGDDE